LHLLPLQLKILRQKVVKKRRHNDNDVCQFVSNSIFELKKRQITAGFCKKFGIRFSVKNQQKRQILESHPQKAPKPLEKFEKLHRETATAAENGSKSPF